MEGRAKAPAGTVGGIAALGFASREWVVYYVRAATRGSDSKRRGTPRQAIAYITGSRDEWRDPGMSTKELEFVAQMGPAWSAREAIVSITREAGAWMVGAGSALAYLGRHEDGPKREFEGGRVPLVGFGRLAGDWADERDLTANFQWDCFPWHVRRGKAGYKSFTLTLPKEISLFAEGHRQAAKAMMCDAATATLEDAFPGLDLSAVGAIHTRNEAGEVHFHMHLLVAKFARNRSTDRMVSVNSKAGGNAGTRIWDLKRAWQRHIDRLLKERLGIEVDQAAHHGPVAIRLGDGTRLGPLNTDSRRVLEKQVVAGRSKLVGSESGRQPMGAPGDSVGPRRIKLGVMDDRIYEIASGGKGIMGWSAAAFTDLFPEHARFVGRYEKRVLTLKHAGYLTAGGRVTADFMVHYGLRRGVHSPELHGIRADLRREAERESKEFGVATRIANVSEAMDWNPGVRKRLGRLELAREEVRRNEEETSRRAPARDQLERIRADKFHVRVPGSPAPAQVPLGIKALVRAFVDVQAARVRWIFAVSTGIVSLNSDETRNMAAAMLRAARDRLALAHEKHLSRAGSRLRPWFWAIRVAMPRDVRRLEIAIERCARLVRSQEVQELYRNVVREARAGRCDTPLDPRLDDFAGVAFALEAPAEDARMLLQAEDRTGTLVPGPEPARASGLPSTPAPPARILEPPHNLEPPRTPRRPRLPDPPNAPEPAQAPEPSRVAIPAAPPAPALAKDPQRRRRIVSHPNAEGDGLERSLRKGLAVLAQHQPKGTPAKSVALDQLEHEVIEEALRIGRLLEREERSQHRLSLPAVFEQDRAALERVSVRLGALGLPSPFTQEALVAIPPLEIRRALGAFEKSGLLAKGGQWTLQEGAARTLSTEWRERLQQQLDQDLGR
jgi:hypothetical protein